MYCEYRNTIMLGWGAGKMGFTCSGHPTEWRIFGPAPRANRSTWQLLTGTFLEGARSVRGRPVLMALLATSLIAGAASEGLARLWEAHFLNTFHLAEATALTPATWCWAVACILLLDLVGSVYGPTYETWLNQHIDSRGAGRGVTHIEKPDLR